MEAGLGTLLRMGPGQADVVLVVAEPSAKAIEVARRAADVASKKARVIVVANRVRGAEDLEVIRRVLGEHELVEVPEEPAIARADREGVAPIDVDENAPGVRAILEIGERLTAQASPRTA